MRRKLAVVLALVASAAGAQSVAPVSPLDRLASVRTFVARDGDALWPGYARAPFEFLLIDGGREELLCRDTLPSGFVADGTDPATGCARAWRPASGLPDKLLAAFPVFGPPSTIVMGTPESTGKSPAAWTMTIMHEHFHQWQNALPTYGAMVAALGLQSKPHDGRWMLDYPFPYDEAAVQAAHAAASRALADAVEAPGGKPFTAALARYRDARAAFAKAAGERNWRYADFELWQEGVARWTEIALGSRYPDGEVKASATALRAKTLEQLRDPNLTTARREFVYPYGAAEAMLLERCDVTWRTRYPTVVALGPLLDRALSRCRSGKGNA